MKDKLEIIKENICKLHVDAIICHANTELEMEDEITKKIMRAGGDKLQSECNQIEFSEKGQAVVTSGGNLPIKYLIHAVISEMGTEAEEDKVMSAIRDALTKAKEKGVKTLAIPLMSDSFGIPIRRAAELILTEVKKHFDFETTIEKILLVASDNLTYNAYEEAVKQL